MASLETKRANIESGSRIMQCGRIEKKCDKRRKPRKGAACTRHVADR